VASLTTDYYVLTLCNFLSVCVEFGWYCLAVCGMSDVQQFIIPHEGIINCDQPDKQLTRTVIPTLGPG
jgi:hypothetical protein